MVEKIQFEKELLEKIDKAENEILNLKKKSPETINKIAEEITSKIIENITGEKLNDSSIKASVEEISKSKVREYL